MELFELRIRGSDGKERLVRIRARDNARAHEAARALLYRPVPEYRDVNEIDAEQILAEQVKK